MWFRHQVGDSTAYDCSLRAFLCSFERETSTGLVRENAKHIDGDRLTTMATPIKARPEVVLSHAWLRHGWGIPGCKGENRGIRNAQDELDTTHPRLYDQSAKVVNQVRFERSLDGIPNSWDCSVFRRRCILPCKPTTRCRRLERELDYQCRSVWNHHL